MRNGASSHFDGAPKTVKEGCPKAEADDIAKQLTEAGATAEVK